MYKANLSCFFVTVTPGLETVLADEIAELGIDIQGMKLERGKVVVKTVSDGSLLEKLCCADNIYCVVKEFNVGTHKSDLVQIGSFINRINWESVATEFCISSREINVSASRRGKHTYSRFEIKQIIEDVLKRNGFISTHEHESVLSIRADIDGTFCRISIKRTDSQFRFRGNTRIFLKGSIRPTVAAALVRISKPSKKDVFYDPFCGSGTIPYERTQFPARRILASDIEKDAVMTTKENCKGRAIVFRCDARETPSQPESIDVIVSNPPWNKQIEVEEVTKLYVEFLKEAKRILKPSGRMVLLTDCHEEITMAIKETGLHYRSMYHVSLHGLHPKIYVMTKESYE